MLNVDKYREEIFEEIEIAMKGSSPAPIVLAVSRVHNRHTGEKCDFFELELEWLFSEYEPPLLKNGDGLKPGDWIMVSDDDKIWVKKPHEECQGSGYSTASCPVHSVKAAQRHIKNHPEIEKGTKVILVSRFRGLDVVFTK